MKEEEEKKKKKKKREEFMENYMTGKEMEEASEGKEEEVKR